MSELFSDTLSETLPVARAVGLSIPLTLYVARHSWTSAAKANGIPLSVISEGMGHDSETTTRIYLASLDTSAIDKANGPNHRQPEITLPEVPPKETVLDDVVSTLFL